MTDPPLSKSYTVSQAATALAVARTTINDAIRKGHIPIHLNGAGAKFVTLEDVQAYLNDPPPVGYWSHKKKR